MFATLAYLSLRRSIQLLVLLARGDAASSSWCCATSSASFVAKSHDLRSSPRTAPCWLRSVACCPDPAGPASSSSPRRYCVGTAAWSPDREHSRVMATADHRWTTTSSS